MADETDKWDRRHRDASDKLPTAADVLQQNQHLLPQSGVALDLACGLGGNSLLLAARGLSVTSWDSSAVAIAALQQHAAKQGLAVQAAIRNVVAQPPTTNSFDVIVVTHFLERQLCAALQAALKPGGLLFYQTWCRERITERGPRNCDYLLEDNELLRLFAGLSLRVYREETSLGCTAEGWRDRAMLIAQKPR